ncbi:hypothetical protein, partial [Thiolapillus sp.]|uniref:hypothetical protein n=1 Tax=Thiolapillus sp. TaxID=2017437 RepID=UPI003AF64E5C
HRQRSKAGGSFPQVLGDTKERKQEGNPSRQMAGSLTNARARAHTQGENYKTPGVFLSADIVKYIWRFIRVSP